MEKAVNFHTETHTMFINDFLINKTNDNKKKQITIHFVKEHIKK